MSGGGTSGQVQTRLDTFENIQRQSRSSKLTEANFDYKKVNIKLYLIVEFRSLRT